MIEETDAPEKTIRYECEKCHTYMTEVFESEGSYQYDFCVAD